LRIRVAEYLGVAPITGGVASLPTDSHDLDLVGRLVNDGYRRFLSENDKWSFLNVPLSVRFVSQSSGSITSASATTVTVASLAGLLPDDHFNGWNISLYDTGTRMYYELDVADYTGATGVFTFTAVPPSIGAGDILYYAGARNPGGMAWRYYLPDDFYGLLKAPFTYDENGPRITIEEVSEPEIREFRAGARTSGTPTYVAFRPINTTTASDGRRWEALFWPEPTGGEVVTAIYKRFPQALANATDVSVAGFQHDHAILEAALAEAERLRNDQIGIHEAAYQAALARSKRLDARAAPARNRPYGDGDSTWAFRRPSSYARPTSYGGTPLE
jgi:hypothetical protein